MPSTLYTHDLIVRIKRVAQEKKLTPQNIYDMLEAEGHHVSLNSIKRLFRDGSEHEHFNFQITIQPIASVLLDIEGADSGDSETEGLKATLKVKKELIEKLERELADVKTDSARRSTFLMDQIRLKDERIDKLMARVDEVLSSNRDLLQQLQRLIEKLQS